MGRGGGDEGETGELRSTVRGDVEEAGETEPAEPDRELTDEGGDGLPGDVDVAGFNPIGIRCE